MLLGYKADTGIEKADGLAIIVTFQGKKQLLDVPEIQTSSGEQGMTVYQAVEKWSVTNKIQARCCNSKQNRSSKWCLYKSRKIVCVLLYFAC